jgi:hypothetical protein
MFCTLEASLAACYANTPKIQTKFSPVSAHDPSNIPYNSRSPIPDQVDTSIKSSLHNLRTSSSPSPSQPGDPADHTKDTTYLDSVLLHSPLQNLPDTLSAWRTLESHVSGGRIKNLGISNTPLPILQALWDNVSVKPAVVQNRFSREEDGGYDQEVRRFCRDNGIVYQSFWTLSANPQLLNHTSITRLAGLCSISREAALYALVLGLDGTCILNGTKNHMVADVQDLGKVRRWVGEEGNQYEWKDVLKHFKDATGDNNPEEMPVESADGTKHVRRRERGM